MDKEELARAAQSLYDLRQENVETAYAMEEKIVVAIRDLRASWVELARLLYEFHAAQGWTQLGYEQVGQWLASPDIELGRRTFFNLVEMWRELVIERGVNPTVLGKADMTKVRDVMPAIRRGITTAEEALGDAEALTRTDLRDKYQHAVTPGDTSPQDEPIKPDTFHYEVCQSCGSKIRVAD